MLRIARSLGLKARRVVVTGKRLAVEIKTGSRRMIEYLLSPLKRYRHEVIRER
jgi:hypothetical protein